jgi:carbamoyltransferase
VSRKHNPRYWSLIRAVGKHTGFPIVLNTSFNNQAEPIVNSVEDALACFVSTDLDYLVIEDLLISKRADRTDELWHYRLDLKPVYELWHRPGKDQAHEIRHTATAASRRISPELYRLISGPEGSTIVQLANAADLTAHRSALMNELLPLWNARIVGLSPAVESGSCRSKRVR